MKNYFLVVGVLLIFVVDTSGTTAHALNAYQRAQQTHRLEQQYSGSMRVSASKQIYSILNGWNEWGEKVEREFSSRLRRYITTRLAEETRVALEQLSEGDLLKIRRLLLKSGEVSWAEKIETTSHSRFRASLIRLLAWKNSKQMEERILTFINQSGGTVQSALERTLIKLNTKLSFGEIMMGIANVVLIGAVVAAIVGASVVAFVLAGALGLGAIIYFIYVAIVGEGDGTGTAPSF